jgi:hypothetical protein
MLEGGLSLLEDRPLLLELSLRLPVRTLLLTELPPTMAREVALSARSPPSCSASLAFSSAWLCQDRAPSRVARFCWSWASAEASVVSLSAATTCIATRSSRAFCSVSCQERGLHHVDRRSALRSLCALVQELVPHGLL